MLSLSLLLNIGKIFAILSDKGKRPWANDLFIKLDRIGARVLTLVLRMLVGMLSHPTLVLFFKFVIIDVISGIYV